MITRVALIITSAIVTGRSRWKAASTANLPEAGIGEDVLEQDTAEKSEASEPTENRDDRDHRVAQRVPIGDDRFGQPLSPRGPHVILRDHLEHLGAH
jgi:hypothetical protein